MIRCQWLATVTTALCSLQRLATQLASARLVDASLEARQRESLPASRRLAIQLASARFIYASLARRSDSRFEAAIQSLFVFLFSSKNRKIKEI